MFYSILFYPHPLFCSLSSMLFYSSLSLSLLFLDFYSILFYSTLSSSRLLLVFYSVLFYATFSPSLLFIVFYSILSPSGTSKGGLISKQDVILAMKSGKAKAGTAAKQTAHTAAPASIVAQAVKVPSPAVLSGRHSCSVGHIVKCHSFLVSGRSILYRHNHLATFCWSAL